MKSSFRSRLTFNQKSQLSLSTRLKNGASAGILLAAVLTVQITSSILPSLQPGSGYALSFDGISQYIDLGREGDFRINSDMTVSFWIKPDKLSGEHVIISQAGNGENGGVNALYKLYFLDDKLAYHHEYSNGKDVLASFDEYSFTAGKWVHVAVVRSIPSGGNSTKELKLYVDGLLRDSFNFSKAPTGGGAGSLRIGNSEDSPFSFFKGTIDEIRIWDTDLSQSTIQNYICKKVNDSHPDFSDLVAYYRLDSGGGITILDQLGRYNATLVNLLSWVWSEAPIGDESIVQYDNLSSVSLLSNDGDIFTVKELSGSVEGIFIYVVNEQPNTFDLPLDFKSLETSKYWGVKKIGESSATYTVQLDYENSPYTGKADSAQLVSRPNNSVLEWSAKSASNDSENKTLVLGGQSGTEYMLGESGGTSFPVEFLGFNANLDKSNIVRLNWETAWELNNDYFQIERSSESGTFSPIGKVSGAGTTENISSYQFIDPTPISGPSYYRLRQVDFDGAFAYSPTVEVYAEEVNSFHLSFPNPFPLSANIELRVNESEQLQADILTISGQTVEQLFSGKVNADQTYSLKIQRKLSPAIYLLRIKGDRTNVSKKIIISE